MVRDVRVWGQMLSLHKEELMVASAHCLGEPCLPKPVQGLPSHFHSQLGGCQDRCHRACPTDEETAIQRDYTSSTSQKVCESRGRLNTHILFVSDPVAPSNQVNRKGNCREKDIISHLLCLGPIAANRSLTSPHHASDERAMHPLLVHQHLGKDTPRCVPTYLDFQPLPFQVMANAQGRKKSKSLPERLISFTH